MINCLDVRKLLYTFLLICGVVALAGCGGGMKSVSESAEPTEGVAVRDCPDTSFWSTWTPEQRRVNIALGKLSARHLKLDGKRLVLDVTRADFAKAGLADSVYENTLRGLEVTNKWLDTLPLEQVQKEFEESITPLRQLFGEESK